MEPTIYIDMVLLTSWGMHSFLLWMAGRIAGFYTGKWRLATGGFLSAVCYCLWLWLRGINGGFFLFLLLLGIGLLTAYYHKQGRNWMRLFIGSFAASFLLGGGMQVLFTMTGLQMLMGNGITIQKVYPWWILPWSVSASYIFLKLSANWLQVNIVRRKEYCTVAVLWRGKGVEGRMLIDTGNGLKEKGRGVAVVQMSAILPLFSEREQVRILSGDMNGLEWVSFASLGNPDGRLWGIPAEKLVLSVGERKIIHENIFLGINMEEFAEAYEGLVPPCLLEEE